MSNLNKGRKVQINFDYKSSGVTTDGIKAAIAKVEQLETLNKKTPQTDIKPTTVVLTGATPYKVYAYVLAAVFDTGIYDFRFLEEAPNVESLKPAESSE